jgi:hypothetical protein
MSVRPVASHTRIPDGTGIIVDCFDGYPELSIEDWHKKYGLWIE